MKFPHQHKYILDERGEPKPEPDLMKWARWFETANRHVGNEWVEESRVSTVFLGLDHGFTSDCPILWETMVFNGPLNFYQRRCGGNREQAEAMHQEVIAHVCATLAAPPKPE